MKYYASNGELLHEWAHGLGPGGSNRPGTLSFGGRVLYSGSREIAIITRAGVLLEKEPRGLETSHVRHAWYATFHLPLMRLRRVDVLARCAGRGVRYFEKEYGPHARADDMRAVLDFNINSVPILAAVIGATKDATIRAMRSIVLKAARAAA